jgi:hypothetical protein
VAFLFIENAPIIWTRSLVIKTRAGWRRTVIFVPLAAVGWAGVFFPVGRTLLRVIGKIHLAESFLRCNLLAVPIHDLILAGLANLVHEVLAILVRGKLLAMLIFHVRAHLRAEHVNHAHEIWVEIFEHGEDLRSCGRAHGVIAPKMHETMWISFRSHYPDRMTCEMSGDVIQPNRPLVQHMHVLMHRMSGDLLAIKTNNSSVFARFSRACQDAQKKNLRALLHC